MENRLSQKQRLFPNCLRVSNQLSLVYLGLFFFFTQAPSFYPVSYESDSFIYSVHR